ncbi:hypothetical protein J7E78_05260 [Paenibacillus polymyxa]|uniref:hypothetical protein n=1 Tax=Paenibacillus polymyxa TaxID=1406 RepID=UPI001BE86DDF|nr:hypothetical protein [Paenibacillus polymyxa]MBT2282946.1 hypothetical protein [Paenibacillus polymyxa]
MVKLSFVVTSIEEHNEYLLNLIESFVNMTGNEQSELNIILSKISTDYEENLKIRIDKHNNINYFLTESLSRGIKKDIGISICKAEKICFIDSDCILDKDYFVNLKDYLQSFRLIRGKNIFLSRNNWFSKKNSDFRTICEEVFARDIIFTPNLIIDKHLLNDAGGWSLDNLDSDDDFILNQRIRRVTQENIFHVDDALLYNQPDSNSLKSIKTWYGYGEGHGFAYWRESKRGLSTLFQYSPDFVYVKHYPIDYFIFALFQLLVGLVGYTHGIIKYSKSNKLKKK